MPSLAAKLIGKQLRKKALKYNRSTLEVLREITDNEKLIAVLTAQFGDYGLPPSQSSFLMHSALVRHYFAGGNYPVGGSSRIFNTIAPVLRAYDGLVYTNAEVEEILVQDNQAIGVRMADDGKEIFAPLIISDAGIYNTFQHLLPEPIQQQHGLNTMLNQTQPSYGHVCLYVGLKHTTKELGLGKANYWIYPKDAYDHDKNMTAFLSNPDNELPVAYVSFPSAKDPDWDNRYPGRSAIDIITVAPYEWFEAWKDKPWKKRGEDYEAKKEKLAQRLLEKLYEKEPQLRGKVDYYELSTPLSTVHFANYQRGELYGINHNTQRFEQTFLRPKTPIKNLYLTGQDIVSCGVGAALVSGLLTASAITGKNLMKKTGRSGQ